MQDVAAIKLDSIELIDQYMEHHEWRRKINYGGSWQWHIFRHPITEHTISNCHKAHKHLKSIKERYKLKTTYDYGYLYINDLESAKNLLSSPGVTIDSVKQVIVDRPKNTMVIKSAKHNLRTYLKTQSIEIDQKQILINFLKSINNIRLSPGLEEWTTKYNNYRYITDNYFVDHDDDGFLTMLALVSPIKIKKTVTLLTE